MHSLIADLKIMNQNFGQAVVPDAAFATKVPNLDVYKDINSDTEVSCDIFNIFLG